MIEYWSFEYSSLDCNWIIAGFCVIIFFDCALKGHDVTDLAISSLCEFECLMMYDELGPTAHLCWIN